jgi:hypothetical protein
MPKMPLKVCEVVVVRMTRMLMESTFMVKDPTA